MTEEIDRVSQALASWRKRLLDLSRRNPLLYYKVRKASTLQVACPDVFAVVDELDEDGGGWEVFLPPEPRGERPTDGESAADDEGASRELFDGGPGSVAGDETSIPGQGEAEAPPEDALVFEPKSRKDLEKRLRNLRRRSETDLSERGVHVLYLAAGFLDWKDPASNEAARSPLILFPVSLEQESLFDPWRVVPSAEEEILVNPSLRQKMLQDFHLDLPELPSAEEVDRSEGGEHCRKYFADVRECLSRSTLTDWKVAEGGVLDLFSFHKLVMYRDLVQNAGRAAAHAVIKGLASKDAAEGTGAGGGFPDVRELDRRLSYKDQFHVLDADSSQLAVLEAARAGRSLVLQGPPGTGKSQTIANLIAQSVADGRKVLFVSEKMAALEVVKKRLAGAGLDDLCLELHSHKTNRKAVVEQLARSLDDRLVVEAGSALTEEELVRLEERRRELREYVEELHRRREPLGRSVGSVLAGLARLASAPARALPDPGVVGALDAATFVKVHGLVDAVAEHWSVVLAGERHPWHGLWPETHGFQLTVTLNEELRLLGARMNEVRARAAGVAEGLGLPAPNSAADAVTLNDLARFVERSPGVWRGLFSDSEKSDGILAAGRSRSDRSRQARAEVAAFFPSGEPKVPPSSEAVRATREDLTTGLRAIGLGVPPPAVLGAATGRLELVVRSVEQVDGLQPAVSSALGLAASVGSVARLHGLACVTREVLAGRSFVPGYFVAESLGEARKRLAERRGVWARGLETRTVALETFDESVLELDLKRMVEDYRSRYQGPMRFLRPAYFRDRKVLRGATRRTLAHAEVLPALEQARASQVALWEVAGGLTEDRRVFGELAKGVNTDSVALQELLDRAETVLSQAPEWPLPAKLSVALCARGLLPPEIRSACERFIAATDDLLVSLRIVEFVAPNGTLADFPGNLTELGATTAAMLTLLRGAVGVVEGCLQAGLVDPTWDRLLAATAGMEQLRNSERALAAFGSEHGDLLGPAFRGEETNWDDLLAKVAYVREISRRTGGHPPDRLIEIVGTASPRLPECDLLDGVRPGYTLARDALVSRFEKGPLATPDSVDRIPFEELASRMAAMGERLDEVDDVLAVARAEADLQSASFHRNVTAFFDPTLSADEFRNGVRRSILQAWVDAQGAGVPVLQRFDGRRHDTLVQEFRSLERRFLRSGPARILDRVGDRTSDGNGGEVGLIRREAAKRRRHIPLRKLFAQAYTVIPRLKPCLLMSPLSVAQFLKDSPIHFDLVVFDEASQIFTEDAIGAVMRGNQLVVAGDEKQLPPTSFFQASQVDDSDGDEEEDDSTEQPDYESVLAACSTVLPQKMLRWHYRSRHEALIAFSNARFYESRLVTFPSASDDGGQMGVRWVPVPDGVYDRGKSRTNAREAGRIVELVVEHWRNRPDDSLGVVTLSQAQMDRVDDLLQERIRQEPDLEGFYLQEGDERFFVKNLENVQGDERDHIIFGIGYGKDARGILTSGFGPLNRAGGERRLNVAITRAKRRLTAVASFRHSELQVAATAPPGVLQLQKFLEFAERGPEALETSNVGSGEAESPLEESIAAFLREKGFGVDLQVGCSGFRLDIGVRDPALPGRFALGVECDGATYHSAATVRDRDRLRQSVLEGHGWRIHRIWGPDWVRRRTGEEARLLDAVSRACQAPPGKPASEPETRATPVRSISRDSAARPTNGVASAIPTREFRAANAVLSRLLLNSQPHEASQPELASVFLKLAIEENGIARDRAFRLVTNAWGVQRIGHRIRANFDEACARLAGQVTLDGEFILPLAYKPAILRPGTDASTQRDFVHVPPGELLLAIRSLLERNGVMARAELEREVTSMYGCRAALNAHTWLSEVLERAVRQGLLALVEQHVELVG